MLLRRSRRGGGKTSPSTISLCESSYRRPRAIAGIPWRKLFRKGWRKPDGRRQLALRNVRLDEFEAPCDTSALSRRLPQY